MERIPAPLARLRGALPAEMRIVKGAFGFAGGVALLFGVFVELLGGNWRLGFTHRALLTPLFALFVPAALGIGSPLWFWIGRPLAYRFDLGPTSRDLFGGARFLPGLAGSLAGYVILSPVTATSGFWTQILFPFGLLLGIATPLWYWLLGPVLRAPVVRLARQSRFLPDVSSGHARVATALGGLLVLAVVITALISVPMVGVGDSVRKSGLDVEVEQVAVTPTITAADGEQIGDDHTWGLVLVQLSLSNDGTSPVAAPGSSVGDIAVISEVCRAQTFGEPANNCNQVYLDGSFTAGGRRYADYEMVVDNAGGQVSPGEELAGWMVYRVESRPDDGIDGLVIVDGVGRWRFAA